MTDVADAVITALRLAVAGDTRTAAGTLRAAAGDRLPAAILCVVDVALVQAGGRNLCAGLDDSDRMHRVIALAEARRRGDRDAIRALLPGCATLELMIWASHIIREYRWRKLTGQLQPHPPEDETSGDPDRPRGGYLGLGFGNRPEEVPTP